MRIALVSSVKRSASGELLAQSELAGRSVLSWQVEHALRAGCERIICLCDAPAPHIIDEQHLVEGLGLGFHTVRSPLQIPGLVRADDDILMQLDGLIVTSSAFESAMGEGDAIEPSIQALPADHLLAANYPDDFERIDKDRHWAGIAVIPGACASALEDMPGDGDAMSLLLRLGLQVRVPVPTLGADILDDNQWFIVRDLESNAKLQEHMMTRAIEPAYWTGPGALLATFVVKATGTRWLGSGAEIAATAALGLMVIAAGLAGFGQAVAGLGVGIAGAFLAQAWSVLERVRAGLWANAKRPLFAKYLKPLILAFAALVLVLAHLPTSDFAQGIAIPLIAIGLAEVARRQSDPLSHAFSRAFWHDTPAHFAFFCFAALFGVLTQALLVFSLGALLQLMLRKEGQPDRG